jgi:SAM-dependent methyltransferase
VGCGVGATDSLVISHFRSIEGVDVSRGMIDAAAERNPSVGYAVYDGINLPYEDKRFDLVFAIGVMHHVRPEDREPLMRHVGRVVRPGGLMVVFEHNGLNPFTRRIVRTCEFDEEAVLLPPREVTKLLGRADGAIVERRFILIAPWRNRLIDEIERRLSAVPLGAQYYVAARSEEPRDSVRSVNEAR